MGKIRKVEDSQWTPKKIERFFKMIFGDDLDFYEEYLIDLTDEEQNNFFLDNPDFMSEFPVNCDRMYLLRDKDFRCILRKIKKYEGGKKCH